MVNRDINIPNEIKGQAKVILKGLGLQALKPAFFAFLKPESEDAPQDEHSDFGGIPVFDNIIFGTDSTSQDANTDGKIKTISGGIQFTKINGKTIKLQSLKINLVLMDVNRQKNIVKTMIPGSDITIKEYISADDYQITIRGAIRSESPYTYPERDMAFFIEYMDAPLAIPVSSKFLSRFGINSIVVESCRIYQVEGMRNLQFFEINAISDDVTVPASFQNVVSSI